MKARSIVRLVPLAILLAMPVASPGEASAANGDQACENLEVCVYQNTSLQGYVYTHAGSKSYLYPLYYSGTGISVDNNTESVWNRGSSGYRVYLWGSTTIGKGTSLCLPPNSYPYTLPGGYIGNLTGNTAGSHSWASGASC